MLCLTHVYIVMRCPRLMDAQHTHDELHLVFEYVETDLHRLMRKQPLLDVDIVKVWRACARARLRVFLRQP